MQWGRARSITDRRSWELLKRTNEEDRARCSECDAVCYKGLDGWEHPGPCDREWQDNKWVKRKAVKS